MSGVQAIAALVTAAIRRARSSVLRVSGHRPASPDHDVKAEFLRKHEAMQLPRVVARQATHVEPSGQ